MSEEVHPRATRMDAQDTGAFLKLMNSEDRRAVKAVGDHIDRITAAVEAIASRVQVGGSLHYFGAGTSGRIAELDAAECAPTFGVDVVHAHAAGDGAAEDDAGRGQSDAWSAQLSPRDAVVGVSASGRTEYVLGAVIEAKAAGALVVGLTCATGTPLGELADVAIEIETGPEVIAGSTRLKGGTVQKAVLNMISTGVFVRLGHTYRGRMTGLVAANVKLRHRAIALICDLTDRTEADASEALEAAEGNAKVAVVMLRGDLSPAEASKRLRDGGGDLAAALGERSRA